MDQFMEAALEEARTGAAEVGIPIGAALVDGEGRLVATGRPPRLDLELYPYLPRVRVSTTSARDYMTLLAGRAA